MIQRLYNWSLAKISSPAGERWLGVLSFAESSFFPIPPDILMLPMILADHARAWRLAAIVTVTNILGAILGYIIGAFFFDLFARPILEVYGYMAKFGRFEELYNEYGVLVVLVGSFTPIPFKVITIASGVFSLNPIVFLATAIPSRALRFYLGAALLWKYGSAIRQFIEKRLAFVFTGVTVLFIGGFLALKWL